MVNTTPNPRATKKSKGELVGPPPPPLFDGDGGGVDWLVGVEEDVADATSADLDEVVCGPIHSELALTERATVTPLT